MAQLRAKGAFPMTAAIGFDTKYKSTHFMFLRKSTVAINNDFVPLLTHYLGTQWFPARTSGITQASRGGRGRIYSRRRKRGIRTYQTKPAKPTRSP